MAGIQTLAKELYSPNRERRELAIDCIVDVAIETGEFDDARDLLRERWSGPDYERDSELWQRLTGAIREVTHARGRKRSLRHLAAPDVLPEEDKALAWAGIELVFDAASIYDGPVVLDDALQYATPEQRAIHAIWWTQSEVCNGGFAQYFMNATAVVWPHLVAGVDAIGAKKVANIVDMARRAFPAGDVPRDRSAREQVLDDVDGAGPVTSQQYLNALG